MVVSYCLNPKCPNPTDPLHEHHRICRHCGSLLQLQGRYRVQRLLGEGGFGTTYEVLDEQAGTSEVKVLKVLSSKNRKAIELFQREAEVLQRLHHPGIPQVESDGYFIFAGRNQEFELHCLVMEFIAGENLEQWMGDRDHRPITETQTVEWLIQLVEILQQVHQQNYFHRDIKPSNIMRRLDSPDNGSENSWSRAVGQLALIDFGSARQVSGTYLAKVAGGGSQVTGIISPGYTPPEQANGKAVPQSDFYALARTFVYLLTGKEPNTFPEDSRNGELQWRSQVEHIFPPLVDLLDYMMAPFPGNRPQNTYLILQQLQEIRATLQSGGYSRQSWRNRQRRSPLVAAQTTPGAGQLYRSSPPTRSRQQVSQQISRNLMPSNISLWVFSDPMAHKHHHRRSHRRSVAKYAPKLFMGAIALTVPVTVLQLLHELDLQYLLSGSSPPSASSVVEAANHNMIASPPVEALPLETILSQPFSKNPSVPGTDFVLTKTLTGHVWGVNAVDLSPDAKVLVSGSVDKTVKIWEVATGALLHTLSGHSQQIWSVTTSPDGKMLATAGGDGKINLWEVSTGYWLHTIESFSSWVISVAFSPDGKTLASGSRDGIITLWDVENDVTGLPKGVKRKHLYGHTNPVLAIAYSKSQPILVSGSSDGQIKIWDLTTGTQLRTLQRPREQLRALAISPNGQKILSGSDDGTFNLWDLNTGELMLAVKAHSDAVRSVTFGLDGRTVITGGGALDSQIKVWDATTGERLQVLSGHSDTVHSLKLSADGQILTSGSEDNTIKIWRVLSTNPENAQ